MVEIVRERLLNGWTSEEESDVVMEFSDHEIQANPVVVEPEATVESVPFFDNPYEYYEEEAVLELPEEPKEPNVLPEPAKGKKSNKKKAKQSVNTKLEETPKLTTPQNTNPWFALAAMNMNTSFMNQSKFKTPDSKGSKKPNGKKTGKPANSTPNTPQNLNVANIASSLLKRPVTMTSVANAAAALMQSPAALRAFSELRKREMEKYMENANMKTKVNAAAQAAVTVSQNADSDTNVLLFN